MNIEIECAICYGPAEENVRCVDCRQLFCGSCIRQWSSQHEAPTCPMCRRAIDQTSFVHDSDVQTIFETRPATCDICETTIKCVDLKVHRLACLHEEVGCPFQGCTFRCSRSAMDIHTAGCSMAPQCNLNDIIEKVCERARTGHQPYIDEHLIRSAFKADEKLDTDGKLLYHYIQPQDTLAGVAIKYGCTRESILRQNNLSNELQLFSRSKIVVPRPPGWVVKREPDLPFSVLIALKKKQLTRRVMLLCKCSEEEAVSYLHLTRFQSDEAIRRYEEDNVWLLQNTPTQPKSLKEFLQRNQKAWAQCSHCHRSLMLTDSRCHCTACGTFFCKACNEKGHCSLRVPKRILGVTNPETVNVPVCVCNSCFLALRPMMSSKGFHPTMVSRYTIACNQGPARSPLSSH
eukprot:gene125-3516_t